MMANETKGTERCEHLAAEAVLARLVPSERCLFRSELRTVLPASPHRGSVKNPHAERGTILPSHLYETPDVCT